MSKRVWLEDNVSHVQMTHGFVLNPGWNDVPDDTVADALIAHGPPFYADQPSPPRRPKKAEKE